MLPTNTRSLLKGVAMLSGKQTSANNSVNDGHASPVES